MNRLSQMGSASLQAAFLRDEIPAAMLWLRREGRETVDARLLECHLDLDTEVGSRRLDELVEAGLLSCGEEGRYALTEAGSAHGARVLDHHFAELDNVSLGFFCECGCCGDLPIAGESLASQRERARIVA